MTKYNYGYSVYKRERNSPGTNVTHDFHIDIWGHTIYSSRNRPNENQFMSFEWIYSPEHNWFGNSVDFSHNVNRNLEMIERMVRLIKRIEKKMGKIMTEGYHDSRHDWNPYYEYFPFHNASPHLFIHALNELGFTYLVYDPRNSRSYTPIEEVKEPEWESYMIMGSTGNNICEVWGRSLGEARLNAYNEMVGKAKDKSWDSGLTYAEERIIWIKKGMPMKMRRTYSSWSRHEVERRDAYEILNGDAK